MSAMSSAKSRSSSFDVKFHLIPVLFPAVVFLIMQSTTIKKINLDITIPCLTPVLTLNHSDSHLRLTLHIHYLRITSVPCGLSCMEFHSSP